VLVPVFSWFAWRGLEYSNNDAGWDWRIYEILAKLFRCTTEDWSHASRMKSCGGSSGRTPN
jgi:hypothetical protein